MNQPLITVFTPAYNRARTLPGLYESLRQQNDRSFEWLIVDDGSTDDTEKTVKKGLNKAEEAEYESIMEELPKLEHLVKGLDVMISQVSTDYEKMQSLMAEREETQSQIDDLTDRWMELEERL